MADEQKKRMAAYVSFQTFVSFLEYLNKQGIPHQLDSSAWSPNLSGASRSALKSSLQFLNLIDDESRPTELLENLIGQWEKDKKEIYQKIFANAYGNLIGDIDLEKATVNQLKGILTGEGETKDKQYSFFINLAKEADVKLSKFALSATRKSTGRKSGIKKNKRTVEEHEIQFEDPGDFGNDSIQLIENIKKLMKTLINIDWPDNLRKDFYSAVEAINILRASMEEFENKK